MSVDNLSDHSCDTHRIIVFHTTLNSIGDPFNKDSWLDDLYETDYGPEDDLNDDWMDDLDEAA